jgi:hypothetical protein
MAKSITPEQTEHNKRMALKVETVLVQSVWSRYQK